MITRRIELCTTCNKQAKEVSSQVYEIKDKKSKWIKLECGHLLIRDIPKGSDFESLTSNWWADSTCYHEWDKNRCINCNEYRPYPFQVEGAAFLETALATSQGGGIFDEMGLGKTIQALTYLHFHPEAFPCVFVVKSGIKFQWFKEILRWLGPSFIPQVVTSSSDFILPQMKSYVISYDMLVFKHNKKTDKITGLSFEKFNHCKTVVLDECQQIKNSKAGRTKQVRELCRDKKVIALSGTPWKNRGSEYYPVLNILAPHKFPTEQGFLDTWVDYYMENGMWKAGGIRKIPQFKEYVSDVCIRREVTDVGIQMPDVMRTMHYVELDKFATSAYNKEVEKFVSWYNELTIGGEEDEAGSLEILARMARLRHIVALAKIPATLEYAEEFKESTTRKLTIFVHHIDVGDQLYRELKENHPDLLVLHLTGAQSAQERFDIAERFQKAQRAFLVASTLAAGEGINLQTCGDAILHERQWNPQNEDQAAPGRFRRIGAAHNTVNVTFMTATGTIDEILAGIVEKKRAYFHNAMNKGEMPRWNQAGLAKELAEGLVKDWNSKR